MAQIHNLAEDKVTAHDGGLSSCFNPFVFPQDPMILYFFFPPDFITVSFLTCIRLGGQAAFLRPFSPIPIVTYSILVYILSMAFLHNDGMFIFTMGGFLQAWRSRDGFLAMATCGIRAGSL